MPYKYCYAQSIMVSGDIDKDIYKDTTFRLSQMGADAGALGVAMLIRNKVIGL